MYGNLVQVCLCSWNTGMDIPSSDSFESPLRKGYLQKLTGRGWLYSGTWKRRYCILDGSKFYFYEKEDSKGTEKASGVISLDHHDVCEESTTKDKKNQHGFVMQTSVRGFFDNRHQFAAETAEELKSWIRAIQEAIEKTRKIRRKEEGKQRHLDEKAPESSSQESEGPNAACLVNATKDRAKGPMGRRLPQRRSMMPTSRSPESVDVRQRSISLSSPKTSVDINEDTKPSSDARWLSLSLEEVECEREDMENQRSSSVFYLQQTPSETNVPSPAKRSNHLGQKHAALTRELEMKLKAGLIPGGRRLPSETEESEDLHQEQKDDQKIEQLSSSVDSATEKLKDLEEKVGQLSKQVETSHSETSDTTQVADVLLQVTVVLQEAGRINDECKRALTEMNMAKTEYQLLSKKCRETLAKLNNESEPQQNGA